VGVSAQGRNIRVAAQIAGVAERDVPGAAERGQSQSDPADGDRGAAERHAVSV
jgi:hypothetical protein